MAALVIPDEKLLILPHETYFRVAQNATGHHPWPVLPSRADGAHMPELFCFSLWCEKIWTCACWLQWSRFGSRDVTTPTACVGWQKQSEMFVFISSPSFSLDCGKKWKVVFVLSECHAETSWTTIVAQRSIACRLIERSWVRIPTGAGLLSFSFLRGGLSLIRSI